RIAQEGKAAIETHHAKVQATLSGYTLPACQSDFNTAMKGKRTITTLRDAADDCVAKAKIEINAVADTIRANAVVIEKAGFDFLVADRQQLVEKQPDDLAAVIKSRIADETERKQRESEAAAERERERIRAEEQAKAERAVQEDADQAQEAEVKSH